MYLPLVSVLPSDTPVSRTPSIILFVMRNNLTLRLSPEIHRLQIRFRKHLEPETLSLTSIARHRLLASLFRLRLHLGSATAAYSLCLFLSHRRAHSRRVSRSMSHSGAWQVSAETLIRTRSRLARKKELARGAGCSNERSGRARFGAVNRMNERFLAVRRKQQSSGTRVVPRESQQQSSPLSYHPRTHHFLAPSRRVTLPHSRSRGPCLSPSWALEREGEGEGEKERRITSMLYRTKAIVNPCFAREVPRYHAVKTKRLTSLRRL